MQIWLAEDEAPQREHLAALLRQVCAARGVACELRAFEDGQALVDAYAPGVDLLLLDIDMPGLSGMDAAHRIRERDERVLIVFCTNLVARALDGYAVAALDFLVKPITENRLDDLLDKALRRLGPAAPAALTHRFAPGAGRNISGCPVLDVLLSQKMDECSRVGASLIPCISQEAIGALCALSGPDLCTLYGNLLDNAIEAVSALPDGEDKTVTLRTNLRGNLLVIRTENRYQGERRHAGGGFSTTKADANAHGYGLRSVCDCVHHLGGEMTLSDENRLFVVNVLLPAAGG